MELVGPLSPPGAPIPICCCEPPRLGTRAVAVNLLQPLGRMLKTAPGYADLPPVIGNQTLLLVKSSYRQCNDL
jgi:hypothetical protein